MKLEPDSIYFFNDYRTEPTQQEQSDTSSTRSSISDLGESVLDEHSPVSSLHALPTASKEKVPLNVNPFISKETPIDSAVEYPEEIELTDLHVVNRGWAAVIRDGAFVVLSRVREELKKTGPFFLVLRRYAPFALLALIVSAIIFLVAYALVHAARQVALFIPMITTAAFHSLCEINSFPLGSLCPETSKAFIAQLDTSTQEAQWADFPTLVMVQNALTDTFVGENPGASEMALQIAKAELATSDLIAAVRYSNLRTAGRLADALREFVNDAAEAGDSLQELDATAMGAMDSILNINIWAQRGIEQASTHSSGALRPFTFWRERKTAPDAVSEMFNEAMNSQSVILTKLIIRAQRCIAQLKRMKERLQAIRDLIKRENILLTSEQDAVLALMWTTVGGNRDDLRRFSTNLELLANLEKYTDHAKQHVSQALLDLKTMQTQMKDLRDRVSRPDIAGTKIPVGVHIRSIADGIRRIKEGRIRAKERERDIRTLGAEE